MNHIRLKCIKLFLFMQVLCLHACNSSSPIILKDKLIEDLEYLNKAIIAGHPVTLNKAWINELGSYIVHVENSSPEDLSAFEYENIIREALTKVGCSHTRITESPVSKIYLNQIGKNKFLPVRCFADSSGLYLIDAKFNNKEQQIDFPVKVISINGLDAAEIIDKLVVYQPADGKQKTLAYAIINDFSEILIRRCFIGVDDFTIKFEKENGVQDEINMHATEEYLPKKFQYFQPKSNSLLSESSIGLFTLSPKSMYLKIKSMDYKNYKKVNRELFQQLEDKEVENLVIDLRGNGGGPTKSMLDFLSYILSDTLSQVDIRPHGNVSKYLSSKIKLAGVWFWDKTTRHSTTDSGVEYITNITYPKKNQYKGKIFILIDGYTASSACSLTANLKFKASAICIGQETAGGETGCNANSFQKLVLPNSKIIISFPLFRFNNELLIPDNHHGIIPGYIIHYTATEYMLNKDLEMDKVFSLIK